MISRRSLMSWSWSPSLSSSLCFTFSASFCSIRFLVNSHFYCLIPSVCAGGRGVVVGPIVSQSLSDVFCDNEYGPNFLFRNNGNGTFADVAQQAGVKHISTCHGLVYQLNEAEHVTQGQLLCITESITIFLQVWRTPCSMAEGLLWPILTAMARLTLSMGTGMDPTVCTCRWITENRSSRCVQSIALDKKINHISTEGILREDRAKSSDALSWQFCFCFCPRWLFLCQKNFSHCVKWLSSQNTGHDKEYWRVSEPHFGCLLCSYQNQWLMSKQHKAKANVSP